MNTLVRRGPLVVLRERLQAWVESRRAAAPLPVRTHVDAAGSAPTTLLAFDRTLVLVALALVFGGLVMVYSSSIALPDSRKFADYAPTHFLMRHALAIAIGSVAALAVVQLPIAFWEKHAPRIFVLALVLLVLVLLPFVGVVVNKSRRWIPLGFMMFQPAELAKLAVAMYAASYMVRRMDARERFFRAVWPMAVVANSPSSTASSTALMLTSCATFQLLGVKVSCAGSAVTWPPPSTVTTTSAPGATVSRTL